MDFETVTSVSETTYLVQGRRRRTTVPRVVQEIMELKNGDGLRWIVFEDRTILQSKAKAGL